MYASKVIKSFRHKGLRKFFVSGSVAGIKPEHTSRIRSQLAILNTARVIDDVDKPGFRLHRLSGAQKDRWSIRISGNWRITFEFRGADAFVLDYEDYH